jgi:hypothetical protein
MSHTWVATQATAFNSLEEPVGREGIVEYFKDRTVEGFDDYYLPVPGKDVSCRTSITGYGCFFVSMYNNAKRRRGTSNSDC